jgi:hypothetical protein
MRSTGSGSAATYCTTRRTTSWTSIESGRCCPIPEGHERAVRGGSCTARDASADETWPRPKSPRRCQPGDERPISALRPPPRLR